MSLGCPSLTLRARTDTLLRANTPPAVAVSSSHTPAWYPVMKPLVPFAPLLALAVAFVPGPGPAPAADPVAPAGFTPLFNGRDLAGWHGWEIHKKGASPADL